MLFRSLRKVLFSGGYIFGDRDRILWEPSVLLQYTDKTKEKAIGLNIKAYKSLDFGRVWGALSYRRTALSSGSLQYITPIIGVNVNKFMFAYTYSHLSGDVNFDTGGFHQITLGIDLFCKREKYDCNCPAIN